LNHKLKFKATKKHQKMLRQLDRDSDGKSNTQQKNNYSQKILNLKEIKVRKILAREKMLQMWKMEKPYRRGVYIR
jgi:hypothetical protein